VGFIHRIVHTGNLLNNFAGKNIVSKKKGGIVSTRKNKGLDCSALHLLCLVLEMLKLMDFSQALLFISTTIQKMIQGNDTRHRNYTLAHSIYTTGKNLEFFLFYILTTSCFFLTLYSTFPCAPPQPGVRVAIAAPKGQMGSAG
jgi:hypothetical protein